MCPRQSECYHAAMRTVSALDVRRRFGEIVDQAAAGERIVIERAGQPVAALVPLADLDGMDPERRRADRLAAIDDLRRMARRTPTPATYSAALVRDQRRDREAHISRLLRG